MGADLLEADAMTKYLISFPASAMNVAADELAAVGEAARSVIRKAKEAGVSMFAGAARVHVRSRKLNHRSPPLSALL